MKRSRTLKILIGVLAALIVITIVVIKIGEYRERMETFEEVVFSFDEDKVDRFSFSLGATAHCDLTKNSDGTYSFVMPDRKLLPVTVNVTFSEITFTDVPANSWYAEAVKYVTENGLMLGVGDGKFAPDMVTSRAMVVTVLYRIEGEPKAGAGEEFTDVADGQWYTDAVAWASANGIVLGYDNGKFGPSDTMTREQLAAVMYRYAEYKGLVSDVSGDFSGYTDDGQISSWAVDAMKWATGTALITGTSETTLTPGGSSTRSQLAVILMRYCENIMK